MSSIFGGRSDDQNPDPTVNPEQNPDATVNPEQNPDAGTPPDEGGDPDDETPDDDEAEGRVGPEGGPPHAVASGDTHADEPFVGVDPIYRNHATDAGKPFATTDAERAAVKREREAQERAVARRGFGPTTGSAQGAETPAARVRREQEQRDAQADTERDEG